MAGLCSRHITHDPACRICNIDPRDVFIDWDEKHKEAEAAGTTVCSNCSFEYYKTTTTCPKCGHERKEIKRDE